ncbi:ABC transporter substrate-binding protein [Nonomuraea turcica]|uniref:ABC transporter substrate-binding protein n=1 Tax=Nonomuraea sp. G32 TaxID=3067274 RepID=UPI00273CE78A|nr:ABC transporter substrate-binding protein [Nonomuraea sp. G32]MDP4502303.1 ABC transporter substrate-binding protein [Nonomuraea sp. G32]
MGSPPFRLHVLAVVAALLAVAACGSRSPSIEGAPTSATAATGGKGTLTVGLLNPLTGPFAALGTDVNAGFELYLKSKGGVLSGYGIKVVKEDEGTDPAQGTTKARQLVEQSKAQMVVGLVNSAIAYAVAPYLEQADVPLLITVAGADGLTRKKGGNTFRVSYTSSQDVMPLGEHTCKTLGHKKAAILGLDYSFGWEAAGGFARAYEDAGCAVVQEIYAPLATQDWGPYVNQIKKDEADVVYVVAPGSDGIRLLKAYRDFGVQLPMVAHGSTVDETTLPTEAGTAEGVISSLHYTPQIKSPANDALVAAFTQERKKSANQYADDGWTAGMVLEQALAQIDGAPTPESLRAALTKVKVESPRGPVSFDAYGQAVYNVYIRKVEQRDGAWANTIVSTIPEVGQFFTYGEEKYLAFPGYDKLKGTWAK